MAAPPSSPAEFGPDGIAKESPRILYAEKKIEAEQLQLKRYIKENYSKIRDVERELENLTLELKLTAGPKKAALEHLRKKVEIATERIRVAKLKEDQAKKVWEAAAQVVIDEEESKKQLCDDLNRLVQESTNTQITRLEELKNRLEALNPGRVSSDASVHKNIATPQPSTPNGELEQAVGLPESSFPSKVAAESAMDGHQNQQRTSEVRDKRRMSNLGRGKGNNNIVAKGRGSVGPGWTGAGFDVDGRT